MYSAQINEEAGQSNEALNWYRKALEVVLSARELELVGEEADTESIQPLRKKISDLVNAASPPEK